MYKLIGPALVRQDLPEATSNVSKRLEFIGAELKRLDDRLSGLEDKAGKRQAQLGSMQEAVMRMQQQAGASG